MGVSVSVRDSNSLSTINGGEEDARFLSARSPSLIIESSNGRILPRFYLRGLGNTDFDINASQPVSVVMDEVVQENALLRGFPVFDTDRVEVLRGPQGSLFGRNTPAGVVKFESRKPEETPYHHMHVATGRKDTVAFQGVMNTPLTETVSSRFSILHQSRANTLDNIAPGFEQSDLLGGFTDTAGRLQFGYQSSSESEVLLNIRFRRFRSTPLILYGNAVDQGTNQFVSGFDRDVFFLDAATRMRQQLSSHGLSLRWTIPFEKVLVTSITAYDRADLYNRGDVDGGFINNDLTVSASGPGFIPFASETSDTVPELTQTVQEFRVTPHTSDLVDYQLGLFLFRDELISESRSYDTATGGQENGLARQYQINHAHALYGTFSRALSDRLSLTVGARYSADEKQLDANRDTSPIGAGALNISSHKIDDEQLSWDISGLFQANEKVNLYSRIATGFRAPSLQGRILFGDDVTIAKSEDIINYELGVKSEFLYGAGRVNANAFQYTMKGQQLTAVGGASNTNQLINANRTRGNGFELDSWLRLSLNSTIRWNLSYNNVSIDDADLFVAPCAQCTITNPINILGNAAVNNNNPPYSSRWISNVEANFRISLKAGELLLSADWLYRSPISFFLYESPEFTGAKRSELGARITYLWTTESVHYELSLVGRNLTDEQVAIGGVDFNNRTIILNQPRYVGTQIKMSF